MSLVTRHSLHFTGIAAFMIVLFTMPLGHAAMIIMEKTMEPKYLFAGAFLLGLAGIVLTIWGLRKKETAATFMGLIGGLFVWTGWVEFCYVYFAQRYQVAPLIRDGEIVTKPEYLIMPSAAGIWAIIMMLYLFDKRSNCSFFVAIQKFFRMRYDNPAAPQKASHPAIVTFMEMNVLLLTSYMVLLFAYDDNFLGDRHPVTVFIAFASLAWSAWLFVRLLKIRQIGYAIRYAIPVVIIFWTFVEILGRWDIFKEIWVHPLEYKTEMLIMLLVCILTAVLLLLSKRKKTRI